MESTFEFDGTSVITFYIFTQLLTMQCNVLLASGSLVTSLVRNMPISLAEMVLAFKILAIKSTS